MIYISSEIKNKIPLLKDNTYIVADFDRTITKGNSSSSWSLLSRSNLLPSNYASDRQELYDFYRPIEIDNNLDEEYKQKMMKEWFRKHTELLVEYRVSEDLIEKAIDGNDVLEFRNGANTFLKFLNDNKIPLIFISAGIGNFIVQFLKNNNCNFNNIHISSNMLEFKDRIAVGVGTNIIHSLNKNEVSLPDEIKAKIGNREWIVLLGDQISDIKMVSDDKRDKTIRVGFISEDTRDSIDLYKEYFDIICDEDDSYEDLMNLLFS